MMLVSRNTLLKVTSVALITLAAATPPSLGAQSEHTQASGDHGSPVIGKDSQYVNPLNIEATSKDGSPLDIVVEQRSLPYKLVAVAGNGSVRCSAHQTIEFFQ
jgi:hypothetical protein